MGEVVILEVETTLPIPSERVLNGALKADLERCLVIGKTQEGELWVGSSVASYGDVLMLIERARAFVIRQVDG